MGKLARGPTGKLCRGPDGRLARAKHQFVACGGIPDELTLSLTLNWTDSTCGDCNEIANGDYVLTHATSSSDYPCYAGVPYSFDACYWRYTEKTRNCKTGETSDALTMELHLPNTGAGLLSFPITLTLSVIYQRCDGATSPYTMEVWTATATSASDLFDKLTAGMEFAYSATYTATGKPCDVASHSSQTVTI